MSNIEFKTIKETNETPAGCFPKTCYILLDHTPNCIECGKEIIELENAWFCMLARKFFCWECHDKDIAICNKYFTTFEDHADRLVKIKLKV